jgi:hypothetical protein
MHHFGPNVVHFPAVNKLIQNLQISQGYIQFHILQHFANSKKVVFANLTL